MQVQDVELAQADTPPVGRKAKAGRFNWSTLMLVLPSVALIVGFVVVPFFFILRSSLASVQAYGAIGNDWTIDNYRSMLDPVYVRIILNSLWLALQNTIICLLVGYPVAYFLAFKAGRFVGPLILLLVIPFWASFLVRMSAWMTLLSRGGVADHGLQWLHLVGKDAQLIPSHGAVLIGLLYVFLPSAVFPIYAALHGISRSLLDSASDLGCGPLRTHVHVIVPLGSKGLAAAALFVFAPSLGVFVIPVLLGGGKDLIIGNLIVTLFLEFRDMPFGAAVSVVLVVLVALIGLLAWLVLALIGRRDKEKAVPAEDATPEAAA
jgi:spermidine/putrescine transport system permease protein